MAEATFDLIVIGGSLAGLSLAIEATEAGVERVLVVERGAGVAFPTAVSQHGLTVAAGNPVIAIRRSPSEAVVMTRSGDFRAPVVVIAEHPPPSRLPEFPWEIDPSLTRRLHLGVLPVRARESDVLLIGQTDLAVEMCLDLVAMGAGVVMALGGIDLDRLSRLARRVLLRLEAERRVTVLWRSWPHAIEAVDGFPMVDFGDRRTPDLQFDELVYVPASSDRPDLTIEVAGGTVYAIGVADGDGLVGLDPGQAWRTIRATDFPQIPELMPLPRGWRPGDVQQIEELGALHYNAEITFFERAHSDLWVIRVRPDHLDTSHLPGQYATLGLGYWEPRADTAQDPGIDRHWDRLIRRSYSISSRIFDDQGYLAGVGHDDELEFYVVLVPPAPDRIPGLTPRLALKQAGDRIHLGAKVAGRYSLGPVTDPESSVVLLATGTGEAPHNNMAVELLRKGHTGPIVSVVSVRRESDLGYLSTQYRLEQRFGNYHYLPLPTREPGIPKLYIQDVIRHRLLEQRFGVELDPDRTHVYLCGNPAMIGLPEWGEDGRPIFPETEGACQLLVEAGFSLDRRGAPGNVHYEEYW